MREVGVRSANLRQVRELAARCANLPFPVLFPSLASTLPGNRGNLQPVRNELHLYLSSPSADEINFNFHFHFNFNSNINVQVQIEIEAELKEIAVDIELKLKLKN